MIYQIALERTALHGAKARCGVDALDKHVGRTTVGAAEADVLALAAELWGHAAVGVEVDVADELVGADPEAGRVDHVDKEGVLHGESLARIHGVEERTWK